MAYKENPEVLWLKILLLLLDRTDLLQKVCPLLEIPSMLHIELFCDDGCDLNLL
jgi:hypothetical protein